MRILEFEKVFQNLIINKWRSLNRVTYWVTLKPLNGFYIQFRNGKFDYHTICKSCQSIIKNTKYDCECDKECHFSHKKEALQI